MRIAVLLHERDGDFWTGDYLLKHLAKEWQGAGVSVLPVFGPKGFVSADAAILHVDLTRIPEPYLELARRYRRTVNGCVVDIGKRAFSAHIVRPGDGYEGPVIVKTERNYGGRPEARFAARRSVWARAVGHAKRKLPWRLVHELPADAYPIFASPREVPPGVWRNPNLLVQRLLCERHGDLYALRRWTFLGDCEIHNISFGTTPIVKASSGSAREPLGEVPEVLRATRRRLAFAYGKFDYAVVNSEVVLFDVNRTPAVNPATSERDLGLIVQQLSGGLSAFFETPPAECRQ
jgi:hypothetical protein